VISIFCTGLKSPRDTVYYRIYTEDGEIASIDAQVTRLLSMSVSPPHNVDSLKRAICATERIRDCSRTSLFLSPSSKAPMTDAGRISILTSGGPGSIPEEPVALVIKQNASDDGAAFLHLSCNVTQDTTSPTLRRNQLFDVWKTRRQRRLIATPPEPRYSKATFDSIK
jgi:hypothetical protein